MDQETQKTIINYLIGAIITGVGALIARRKEKKKLRNEGKLNDK